MFSFLVILIQILTCALDEAAAVTGSLKAQPHQYPFLVVFEKHEKHTPLKPIFHGFLVNPFTILTTASNIKEHGVEGAIKDVHCNVVAGQHNIKSTKETTLQSRIPCAVSTDPRHSGDNYNFGLIHVSEPFLFHRYVNRIPIAYSNEVDLPKNCTIAGWGPGGGGEEAWDVLRHAHGLEPARATSMKGGLETTGGFCKGDEGTPLVCVTNQRMAAFGIASKSADCGTGKVYYADLTTGIDRKWFNKALDDNRKKCRLYW